MEDDNIIKLTTEGYRRFMDALDKPPEPNEALRRLMRNESILERVRGVPAQPATQEDLDDPRNPNAR